MTHTLVFVRDCAADGCYRRNTYKKDGKQLCKDHQLQYEQGEAIQAFYGRTIQKRQSELAKASEQQ